jgi:hypothetical protein
MSAEKETPPSALLVAFVVLVITRAAAMKQHQHVICFEGAKI